MLREPGTVLSMSHMLDEVKQQPQVLRTAVERLWQRSVEAAKASRNCPFAAIAARGTSDHAATYAKYLLEIRCGLPVALAAPSVLTLYGARLRQNGALVIGISQSGAAPDVTAVIEEARRAGAVTLAMTNDEQSSLAQAAEHLLPLGAGRERSVAATKTYTATLGALLVFAHALSGIDAPEQALEDAAAAVESALQAAPEIERVAERFRFMEECVVLGRGYNYATALETALKIIETSYVMAKSYSAADFMHGPMALLRQGFPCLLMANSGPSLPAVRDQAARLLERKAELMVFSDDEEMLRLARVPIRVPFSLPDEVAPISYVVYGQLFAYYLAKTRGLNPDRPRALSKVTRTL
ncbi:MAG: SIS domain-containing protein [Fimbriimonadia bacterium]|jgi:glucosamine--fructose-6-phosphate aminotransferase (isomerizing)